MPMLAERRRKTKWTNPGRQALWNRDSGDATFGREMMEKMGWKVGQGLGANAQGIKEPLKISFKNDNKGMGFKDHDNEWIQQQSEFDEFLCKLSSEKKALPEDSQTNTVQSLEERSKRSKARVHYHKFTRGKDLTKYSKKDLECILGRNEKESSEISGNTESCNENIGNEDKSLITAGSMVDYFAKKIQSKKEKKDDPLNIMDPEIGESLLGSRSKDETEENVVESTMELHEKKRKKSKRKKEKDEGSFNEETCDVNKEKNKKEKDEGSCNEGTCDVKKKKNKKEKDEGTCDEKKEKKKKEKDEGTCDEKKEKKKKEKDEGSCNEETCDVNKEKNKKEKDEGSCNEGTCDVKKEKKSKRKKEKDEGSCNEETCDVKKEKNKKEKDEGTCDVKKEKNKKEKDEGTCDVKKEKNKKEKDEGTCDEKKEKNKKEKDEGSCNEGTCDVKKKKNKKEKDEGTCDVKKEKKKKEKDEGTCDVKKEKKKKEKDEGTCDVKKEKKKKEKDEGSCNEETCDVKKEKKSKRKKEKDEGSCNEGTCDERDINNSDHKMISSTEGGKKNKKPKIVQDNDQSNPLDGSRGCENETTETELIEIPKEVEEENVNGRDLEGDGVAVEKPKKKKKRKKEENTVEEFDTENVEASNVFENKDGKCEESQEKEDSVTSAERVRKKKKTSKRDRRVIMDEDEGGSKEKIKKKKKCLEAENHFNYEDCETNENDLNPVPHTETDLKKEKEKRKTKCESVVGNKQENKEHEREGIVGEDPLLYKGELLKKENSLKGTSRNKLLNLIYSTNIEQFSGSNLGGLSGYGIVTHC